MTCLSVQHWFGVVDDGFEIQPTAAGIRPVRKINGATYMRSEASGDKSGVSEALRVSFGLLPLPLLWGVERTR